MPDLTSRVVIMRQTDTRILADSVTCLPTPLEDKPLIERTPNAFQNFEKVENKSMLLS